MNRKLVVGRWLGKTWLQRQQIKNLYLAGELKGTDTLGVVSPSGHTVKTIPEWFEEWGIEL